MFSEEAGSISFRHCGYSNSAETDSRDAYEHLGRILT
jgi:hypothetical protein